MNNLNTTNIVSTLREIIIDSKNRAVQNVNSILTLMYWEIGNKINQEILKDSRAKYGKEIVVTVSRELAQEFGRGFEEKDLEDAILRQLEQFILELGQGFSFIARQKRIQLDGNDFYIDLLFYNRTLKKLVAIDLKIGEFKAAYKGQMELYLRWLDKYEKQEGEESPLGIILCTGKQEEQIELLELEKSGIHVAEYLTVLPPKKQLEAKLHEALERAKEKYHVED